MLRLYDFPLSGNCYKVRLLLSQLGMEYKRVTVDLMSGAAKTPEFLRKNPAGRVPVLELEDGRFLAESNAILAYLAEGTPLSPPGPLGRALVLQWMFFEQNSIEPNIGTARLWLTVLKQPEKIGDALERRQKAGSSALGVLEQKLSHDHFLAGSDYTIADLSVYAYTHMAEQAGIDLEPFPYVGEWIERVEAQENHVSMDA